jgi:LuxR family transcriptional regulator, quorum-sensing system regulator BjaR1
MDEAGDFRLRSGFTVPLLTLDGTVAGFSFAGERLEIDPDKRAILSLLATYALGQALILNSRRDDPEARLAPRESVALQWAAEGKTDWEIAQLMGISEHGVDRHMRFVRHKLGASNRAHAVAEAIRRGIIR